MSKKHYSSKEMHQKNVDKRLDEIHNIKTDVSEPGENRVVIEDYFREKRKDKVWEKRSKSK